MAAATMTERPIALKADEVLAILDGHKTQIRRVIDCACNQDHLGRKLGDWALSIPPHQFDGECHEIVCRWTGKREPQKGDWVEAWQADVDDHAAGPLRCPLGRPGDRLWVRETAELDSVCGYNVPDATMTIRYRADWNRREFKRDARGSGYDNGGRLFGRAVYASKMPRWASRITLEITDVRVERLQEISEEDAIEEGVGPGYVPNSLGSTTCVGHRPMFVRVWNETYGKKAGCDWTSNPWVFAISFRRLEAS